MISLLNRKMSGWTHAISGSVVLSVVLISLDSPIVAWLIGGSYMGFSSQLAFVEPSNRSVYRFVGASLAGGITGAIVAALFESAGW
jgi:hypothetical protein